MPCPIGFRSGLFYRFLHGSLQLNLLLFGFFFFSSGNLLPSFVSVLSSALYFSVLTLLSGLVAFFINTFGASTIDQAEESRAFAYVLSILLFLPNLQLSFVMENNVDHFLCYHLLVLYLLVQAFIKSSLFSQRLFASVVINISFAFTFLEVQCYFNITARLPNLSSLVHIRLKMGTLRTTGIMDSSSSSF